MFGHFFSFETNSKCQENQVSLHEKLKTLQKLIVDLSFYLSLHVNLFSKQFILKLQMWYARVCALQNSHVLCSRCLLPEKSLSNYGAKVWICY